jgi:Fungal specific transcription factor domain
MTFLMLAIAARSLNQNDILLPDISTEGLPGALKASNRWKKYGQMASAENDLFRRSSLANVQAMLLLCMLEDGDHVRWNLLGATGNMARIAGLHRDPRVFKDIEESDRVLRRFGRVRWGLI